MPSACDGERSTAAELSMDASPPSPPAPVVSLPSGPAAVFRARDPGIARGAVRVVAARAGVIGEVTRVSGGGRVQRRRQLHVDRRRAPVLVAPGLQQRDEGKLVGGVGMDIRSQPWRPGRAESRGARARHRASPGPPPRAPARPRSRSAARARRRAGHGNSSPSHAVPVPNHRRPWHGARPLRSISGKGAREGAWLISADARFVDHRERDTTPGERHDAVRAPAPLPGVLQPCLLLAGHLLEFRRAERERALGMAKRQLSPRLRRPRHAWPRGSPGGISSVAP